MDGEILLGSAYQGSKHYAQQTKDTANTTGFAAAADEGLDTEIDLNEQLVRNKPATFFMRVSGDAMTDAGIFDGDIVIVDRSIKASSGKVVIAILNGEMLIRRFEKTFNKIRLLPETGKLSPIEVDPSASEFSVWGVVTYSIRHLL